MLYEPDSSDEEAYQLAHEDQGPPSHAVDHHGTWEQLQANVWELVIEAPQPAESAASDADADFEGRREAWRQSLGHQ